jgi:hypothetical protein
VVATDAGQIISGPGFPLAERAKPKRTLIRLPDGAGILDAAIGAVDLSGLRRGRLHSTLQSSVWVETVTMPIWLEELPLMFFANCRSLKTVNLEECSRLRRIATGCFHECVSLRSLSFPDALATIDSLAFASSGLEGLNFIHTPALSAVDVYGAHWLMHLRLPFRLHAIESSESACRIVDLSGGLWNLGAIPGHSRPFRSTSMKGPGGAPSPCLVSAWVAAELVTAGGRVSAPALPC